MKGVSEVVATLLMLIITIAVTSLAYSYINGLFLFRTAKIVDIDIGATYCSNGVITVYVRNIGTVDFASKDVSIRKQGFEPSLPCDTSLSSEPVVARGQGVKCDATLVGTQGNNIIVASAISVLGPSNTVSVNVHCP